MWKRRSCGGFTHCVVVPFGIWVQVASGADTLGTANRGRHGRYTEHPYLPLRRYDGGRCTPSVLRGVVGTYAHVSRRTIHELQIRSLCCCTAGGDLSTSAFRPDCWSALRSKLEHSLIRATERFQSTKACRVYTRRVGRRTFWTRVRNGTSCRRYRTRP